MKIQASACVYKQQWQSRLRSQLQTAITFEGKLSQIRGLACINLWQILHPNKLEWSLFPRFPTFWHFSQVRNSLVLDHPYENLTLTTKKKKLTAATRLREPPRPGVFENGSHFFLEHLGILIDFGGFGNHKPGENATGCCYSFFWLPLNGLIELRLIYQGNLAGGLLGRHKGGVSKSHLRALCIY